MAVNFEEAPHVLVVSSFDLTYSSCMKLILALSDASFVEFTTFLITREFLQQGSALRSAERCCGGHLAGTGTAEKR